VLAIEASTAALTAAWRTIGAIRFPVRQRNGHRTRADAAIVATTPTDTAGDSPPRRRTSAATCHRPNITLVTIVDIVVVVTRSHAARITTPRKISSSHE